MARRKSSPGARRSGSGVIDATSFTTRCGSSAAGNARAHRCGRCPSPSSCRPLSRGRRPTAIGTIGVSLTTAGRSVEHLAADRAVGVVAEGDVDRAVVDDERRDEVRDDLVARRQAGRRVVDRRRCAIAQEAATAGLAMSASATASTICARTMRSWKLGTAIVARIATTATTAISSTSVNPRFSSTPPSRRRQSIAARSARRLSGAAPPSARSGCCRCVVRAVADCPLDQHGQEAHRQRLDDATTTAL